MKVVALQLHIIHSTARLKHHGLNAVNSDLISTGSAQEKLLLESKPEYSKMFYYLI